MTCVPGSKDNVSACRHHKKVARFGLILGGQQNDPVKANQPLCPRGERCRVGPESAPSKATKDRKITLFFRKRVVGTARSLGSMRDISVISFEV